MKPAYLLVGLFFLMFFSVGLISGIDQECDDLGITILTKNKITLKENNDYTFTILAFKSNDGTSLTNSATCSINIYNSSGENILSDNLSYDGVLKEFYLDINGSYFPLGKYSYYLVCEESSITGICRSNINVTHSGEEANPYEMAGYIFLILFCIFIMFEIGRIKDKIDFDKLESKILRKYEQKNFVKFGLFSIWFNLIKNAYVFYYLIGMVIMYLILQMAVFYSFEVIVLVETIVGVYYYCAIIIGLIFFSYIQEWIVDIYNKVKDMNWGIN
jgi:hypothetical protein